MTFPNLATLQGKTFDDVDGAGLSMREWMDAVGAALNTLAAGPVIPDTTNGHTYRITSTNGVIGLTQVT